MIEGEPANQYFVDLKGVAQRLGLSPRTVRSLIHDAQDPLPAYRVGGKWLVHWPEVVAWVKKHPATPPETVDHVQDVIAKLEGK